MEGIGWGDTGECCAQLTTKKISMILLSLRFCISFSRSFCVSLEDSVGVVKKNWSFFGFVMDMW